MSAALWTGKAIVALSLHKPRMLYQRFDIIIMIALYSYALNWCYQTAGVPWQDFLSRVQSEEESEAAGESLVVMDDSNELPSNIFDTVVKATSEDKSFWNMLGDAEDQEMDQIPYSWQPDFWPLFLLAFLVTMTALLWLGQDWSVNFKAFLNCTSAKNLEEATIVKVVPRKHRGKADLVPLEGKGTKKIFFVFQKQRWEYDTITKQFSKVAPPTNKSIRFYAESQPYESRKKVAEAAAHYGSNRFEIPLPTFVDMYKEQIKAPFFVFQLFCVLLWTLEEYWRYSVMTLCMILGFEATVVFTRRMNITKLRGMGNKATSCQVLRYEEWQTISTVELLPGDHIRLKSGGKGDEAIIPCDVLLLHGSAVVNEATLTGESIPLMKESVSTSDRDRLLEIKAVDRIHTLYGGTKLMEAKGINNEDYCEGYVLRTGFNSSQGKLVRRIEFSTEKVSGDSKDAGWLLCFLLIFAICGSGYVLKQGLAEGKRSRYELLIHCILIVTSVVPPDLPMQMAIFINSSLATLMGLQVFCIEPFRIPLAGKVEVCCFDKTGTITTDRLHAAGVVSSHCAKKSMEEISTLDSMLSSPYEACLVIGGCHSLVTAAGQTVGDPLESAALLSIGWRYNSQEGLAMPLQTDKPSNKTAGSCPLNTQIKIIQRHHFASKLQRMSVVADIKGSQESGAQSYVLVKGSPEMISTLLVKSEVPKWYTDCHRDLAKKGFRIIALAYKKVPASQRIVVINNRNVAEKDLSFAGFIAFNCKNRADSRRVVRDLRESAHDVIMITGDAILTAAHVAWETSIVREDKEKVLILTVDDDGSLYWSRFSDDKRLLEFDTKDMEELSKGYDMCVSGEGLEAALEKDIEIKKYLHLFSVYARMKPEQKEKVLIAIKATGKGTLMCGDGTNDVGALKAADVGVALLNGFGDVNAEKVAPVKPSDPLVEPAVRVEKDENGNFVMNAAELAWLNDPMVTEADRVKRKTALLQRKELQMVYEEKKAAGEWFAFFKATLHMAQKQQLEAMMQLKKKDEEKKLAASQPASKNKTKAKDGVVAPVEAAKPKLPTSVWDVLENQEEGGVGGSELVKLGDASIAAPFTSKMPSINSTIDIIRQGRCTLVNTHQMYQILALNCLISSYSLSVLYLDGIKFGDRQMTLLGMLSMVCFLCISKGSAQPKLAPVHPPNSIFHPAIFMSLLGQFVIHLSTLMYTTSLARPYLPVGWAPDVKGKFKPSILNTVGFLTDCVQNVSVFTVNYKGRPYMQSLAENTFFTTCLVIFSVATVALTTEAIPLANTWFELTPMVDTEFKHSILTALGFDFIMALSWDRLMTVIFMPEMIPYMKISKEDLKRFVKPLFWASVMIWLLLGTLEHEIEEEARLASEVVTTTVGAAVTEAASAFL